MDRSRKSSLIIANRWDGFLSFWHCWQPLGYSITELPWNRSSNRRQQNGAAKGCRGSRGSSSSSRGSSRGIAAVVAAVNMRKSRSGCRSCFHLIWETTAAESPGIRSRLLGIRFHQRRRRDLQGSREYFRIYKEWKFNLSFGNKHPNDYFHQSQARYLPPLPRSFHFDLSKAPTWSFHVIPTDPPQSPHSSIPSFHPFSDLFTVPLYKFEIRKREGSPQFDPETSVV